MRIYFIVIALFVCQLSAGQVGVGTVTPRGNLEVASFLNGGGFLAPRYSLTGNNDIITVRNPQGGALVSGTLVYNTNTSAGGNGLDEGLVYWNGTIWVGIVNTEFSGAAGWELEGNVINGSHFLGSTNSEALRFRVNNAPAGELHPQGGVSFGFGATANTSNGISIGRDAISQQDATVLGRSANGGSQAVAIGLQSIASQQDAIAIGRGANSGGNRGLALGVLSGTSNQNSTAIGAEAKALNTNAVAIGTRAVANGQNSFALGFGSITSSGATSSIAIGSGSSTNTGSAIAIGENAQGNGQRSIAIGISTVASVNDATIVGSGANVTGINGTALGRQAISVERGTALGNIAIAGGQRSVAIGNDSETRSAGAIAIGSSTKFNGNGTNSTLIGSAATIGGTQNNSVTVLGNGANINGNDNNFSFVAGYLASITGSNSTNSLVVGAESSMIQAQRSIAMGYRTTVNGANGANTSNSVAIGSNTSVGRPSSIAIGNDAKVENISGLNGTNAIAIGTGTTANYSNSIALGNGAVTTTTNQLALNNTAIVGVSTLTASGQIRASNFQGNTANYPDYVFEKYYNGYSEIDEDYKFITLEEASAFAKANGHLKGVKSYDEIKKNDFNFDIGNTSIKNLEKIEEHFLYLTEMNEKVKEQKAIIDAQNSEITLLKDRLDRLEALILKD